MKTRNMSYKDYGISENEIPYIIDFCRNANEEQKKIIKDALAILQPYIAPYVYYSLVDNMSYDDLYAKHCLYISKVDFYAYRRKGMAEIKDAIISNGFWKIE